MTSDLDIWQASSLSRPSLKVKVIGQSSWSQE